MEIKMKNIKVLLLTLFSFLFAGFYFSSDAKADSLTIITNGNPEQSCPSSLLNTKVKNIRGDNINLCDYYGKVVMVVNIASQGDVSSVRRQYEGLEDLYQRYRDNDFVVLAFPSNDFQKYNPETEDEIEKFARSQYKVTFPMFEKVSVAGPSQAPLFQKLTTQLVGLASYSKEPVRNDFQKYLINREGKLIEVFEPNIDPLNPAISELIEKELSAGTISTDKKPALQFIRVTN